MASQIPSALLIDIDGTLFGPEQSASSRVLEAVSAANERIPVALASGRQVQEVGRVARAIGLNGLHIGDNGASMVNADTRETLHSEYIPTSLVKHIVDTANNAETAYFASQNGSNADSLSILEPDGVSLITIMVENIDAALEWQGKFAPEDICSVPSTGSLGECYVNFTRARVDKGRGVKKFAHELGADTQKIVAVGDGYNDLSMFNAVGMPIAMGHAPEAVKAHAVHVVAPVESDGLAEAIERFIMQ